MSLITCPECEGKVSDQAEQCPHCGFPIKKKLKTKVEMTNFVICWNCGWIPDGGFTGHTPCNWCGFPYSEYESDLPFEEYLDMSCEEIDIIKENILENVIKKSPQFSQNALEKRLIDYEEWNKESIRKVRSGNFDGNMSLYGVSCPYCLSPNTEKITAVSRSASVGFFGLFSKKIGKQWHCNNCNSNF